MPRLGDELQAGLKPGLMAGLVVLSLLLPDDLPPPAGAFAGEVPAPLSTPAAGPPMPAPLPPASPPASQPDFAGQPASAAVRRVVGWALGSGDTGGRSFAVIDKRDARLYLFDAGGRLRGRVPVLLGLARGDDTVPGIGDRPLTEIAPSERTTPAGRFLIQPGRNARGEDVLWVDYDAAVSMHRVLTARPAERRLQRLASPGADDNRISFGCINVPASFFDETLWPALRERGTRLYVLPDRKPLAEVFPALRPSRPAAAPAPSRAARAG